MNRYNENDLIRLEQKINRDSEIKTEQIKEQIIKEIEKIPSEQKQQVLGANCKYIYSIFEDDVNKYFEVLNILTKQIPEKQIEKETRQINENVYRYLIENELNSRNIELDKYEKKQFCNELRYMLDSYLKQGYLIDHMVYGKDYKIDENGFLINEDGFKQVTNISELFDKNFKNIIDAKFSSKNNDIESRAYFDILYDTLFDLNQEAEEIKLVNCNEIINNNFTNILDILQIEGKTSMYEIEKTVDLLKDYDMDIGSYFSSNFDDITSGSYDEIELILFSKLGSLSSNLDEKINNNYNKNKSQIFYKGLSNLLERNIPSHIRDEYVNTITLVIDETLKAENKEFSDINFIRSGNFAYAFEVGDSVIKIGKKRNTYTIPDSSYLLYPVFRKEFELKQEEQYLGIIEIMPKVQTLNEYDYKEKENVVTIYQDLLNQGVIWDDAKVNNIGKIHLKENETLDDFYKSYFKKFGLDTINKPSLGIKENINKDDSYLYKKTQDGKYAYVILDNDFMYLFDQYKEIGGNPQADNVALQVKERLMEKINKENKSVVELLDNNTISKFELMFLTEFMREDVSGILNYDENSKKDNNSCNNNFSSKYRVDDKNLDDLYVLYEEQKDLDNSKKNNLDKRKNSYDER